MPRDMQFCPECGMSLRMGDTELKVEGKHSQEVKDVASHLLKQIHDAKMKEAEKLQIRELKRELSNDKIKHLFLAGGFWMGIIIGLGYFVLQVSNSQIAWYRFIIVLFVIPIFFTVVGAFILKTTSALKEENFMKLIALSLKINLTGLKTLGRSKGSQTDSDA